MFSYRISSLLISDILIFFVISKLLNGAFKTYIIVALNHVLKYTVWQDEDFNYFSTFK